MSWSPWWTIANECTFITLKQSIHIGRHDRSLFLWRSKIICIPRFSRQCSLLQLPLLIKSDCLNVTPVRQRSWTAAAVIIGGKQVDQVEPCPGALVSRSETCLRFLETASPGMVPMEWSFSVAIDQSHNCREVIVEWTMIQVNATVVKYRGHV